MSIGDFGDAAHAYSALSARVKFDAATPTFTFVSIAFATRAASVRYAVHRCDRQCAERRVRRRRTDLPPAE